MIKANEVRLGNWILNFINEEIQANNMTIANFDILGGFQPIPLTEEWLLKFGFEFTKLYYIRYNDDLVIYFDGIEIFYFKRNSKTLTLKYVHQLQNLYFALTGEELTLK